MKNKRILVKEINGIIYKYYKKSKMDVVILDYCEHGDLHTTTKVFIYPDKRNLCEKCAEEKMKNKPDKDTLNNVINILKNLHKKISKKKMHLWYPEVYNLIINKPGNWNQKVYMTINNMKEIPKCKCGNKVSFSKENKFKEKCEHCNRSEAVKKDAKKYEEKWLEILKKDFNLHDVKILNNEKYNLTIKTQNKTLTIKKRNILHLKNQGILDHTFIINFDKKYWIKKFKEKWHTYKMLSDEVLIKRYPYIWKLIETTMKEYSINSDEVKFFINNDFKKPKCSICENDVSFSKSNQRYNINCDKHKNHYFASTQEKTLVKYLKELNINVIENDREVISKELDIYIPNKKVAIEFNGLYWHSDEFKEKNYHYNKWKECNDKGIKLITIWEDDWKNKQNIIKSIILNSLNKTPNKIYARKCKIKEPSFYETQDFLNNNHLQGWCPSNINLGLYYNDELVSLMTFGKRGIIKHNNIELLRFCNKLNTNVIGGASKLFNFFNKNNKNKIISYANCDISDGNLYRVLGFKENGYSLNYWWSDGNKKYSRTNFMKHKLVNEGEDPKKTADEILRNKGYYKIYGTGNLKFTY